MDLSDQLNWLQGLLLEYRYTHSNETQLQNGIAEVFRRHLVEFEREVSTDVGRLDFLVNDCICIEVKVIAGSKISKASVIRQLHRYAQSDDISAIMLVTTIAAHRSISPSMNGKPVRVVHLVGW